MERLASAGPHPFAISPSDVAPAHKMPFES